MSSKLVHLRSQKRPRLKHYCAPSWKALQNKGFLVLKFGGSWSRSVISGSTRALFEPHNPRTTIPKIMMNIACAFFGGWAVWKGRPPWGWSTSIPPLSQEVLEKMIDSGMTVMRCNMSHGDHEEQSMKLANLQKVFQSG